MGFNVKKLPYKKRSWKLRYKSYKGGKTKDWDIPMNNYAALGFAPSMSIEEAKNWCSQINAKDAITRTNEKRVAATRLLKEKDLLLKLDAPKEWVTSFEEHFLRHDKKQHSHWLACKSTLAQINLPSEDWAFYKESFYRLFTKKRYSYSYVQKILHLVNLWGKFLAKKRGVYFDPVPYPTSVSKQRLIDSYEEKGRTASRPLSPDMLQLHESDFPKAQYNWLYMSVWLGLRPSEVDQFIIRNNSKLWFIDNKLAVPVLWVYQSKLVGVKKEDRYKPIPIKYPEQSRCVAILSQLSQSKELSQFECGKFANTVIKRPLNKTLQRYFGPGYTCYAGRKGFTDLMLSKGDSFEAISQWMGHKSLDRTWKIYKDKKKVLF